MDERRLFIGIKLPRKISDILFFLRSTVFKYDNYFRWSSGNNAHITLLFLGSIDISLESQIIDKISSCLANENKIKISISSTGAFPSESNPRVLWLGVQEGNEELQKINYELRVAMEELFGFSSKPNFVPHITVGRLKEKYYSNKIDVKEFFNTVYSPMEININSICLFESVKISKGVQYNKIKEFSLLQG
tara:strand:+ start:43 stop:615 length:573 start_codon:yes stop_codon:yes gene_type:complete